MNRSGSGFVPFCFENPDLEKLYPERWPAAVEIITKDGRAFSEWIDYPKGGPGNPLSLDELIEEFNGLTPAVYAKDHREELTEQVKGIEKLGNLREWASVLLRDE